MTITPEKLKQLRDQWQAIEDAEDDPSMTPVRLNILIGRLRCGMDESADALLTIAEREQGLIEALKDAEDMMASMEKNGWLFACAPKVRAALATVGEYPQPS